MIDILNRVEQIPASFPATPSGLSTAAAALDPDMIWARIESYISHRWTTRPCVWIVSGPGWFEPNLTPASVTAVENWVDYAWAAVTLNPSPLGGYELTAHGPYQITANVGSGAVPAEVDEAFRRLAEYMAETSDHPGSSATSFDIGGEISESITRAPAWLARAMQNSGAADLLRPYRRA